LKQDLNTFKRATLSRLLRHPPSSAPNDKILLISDGI
jgi:hypothetical protein